MGKRAMSQELIDLGNRVRNHRLGVHLSQEGLAEIAGISTNTVSRIKGGQTAMSIEIFGKLTRILGVDANVLLGESAFTAEKNGVLDKLFHRVRHLNQDEQEVVLRTMDTLIESLHRCR